MQSLLLFLLVFYCVFPLSAQPTNYLYQLFDQALIQSRQGSFGEALVVWDSLIDYCPDNPSVWSNRGNTKLALGDLKGALDDHSESIRLEPNQRDAYLNRGVVEERLRLWPQAAVDYERIIDKNPFDSEALYNLANVEGALGNWSNAQAYYNRAALARPDFAMAISSQALATYQLDEFDISEAKLLKLIKRYPLLADARASLVIILYHLNLYGEAKSHWAAVVGLDSRYQQVEWLLNIRRWPKQPTLDLMEFIRSIE
uniref:TPR repeat protein n=1 Tax=Paulinella longichromatophora TaxID=1708747 RepID=A0A2H4ZPI4_9EUKA|nr:TPR repeat protein [Paulinella longichromatophora]